MGQIPQSTERMSSSLKDTVTIWAVANFSAKFREEFVYQKRNCKSISWLSM